MVTFLDDDNNLVMPDVQCEYYNYGELGDQLNGLNNFILFTKTFDRLVVILTCSQLG